MKLCKPSFEIIEQSTGLEGVYKQIEYAGRICYKSSNKITPDSAKPFVDRMIKSGHGAVLEHGTVYLTIPNKNVSRSLLIYKYEINPYSKVVKTDDNIYITTNYRVIIENNWLDSLQYLCEPTEFHEKRICVRFICDRGILAEFTRHRVFSFSAESTRYCNYSKNKFNNELTFIIPCWCDDIPNNLQLNTSIDVIRFVWGTSNVTNAAIENKIVKRKVSNFTKGFLYGMIEAENIYLSLISAECKPQEARAVLPNALKTELVMTGFISDWKHFFGLRCSSSAHPQARELAIPLKEEFIKKGYITE